MSGEEQTRTERLFTELFHRLPTEAPPLGFRDEVMARLARERSRRWEWIVAAAVAIPNLLFLLWQLVEGGEEIGAAIASLTNALLGVEEWDAGVFVHVDGLLLLALAFVGLAGLLVTHALLAEERSRSGWRAA
jgi:hypothetical protein